MDNGYNYFKDLHNVHNSNSSDNNNKNANHYLYFMFRMLLLNFYQIMYKNIIWFKTTNK